MEPYRRLAIDVIMLAVSDLTMTRIDGADHVPDSARARQLMVLRRRVEAGRFLMVRQDELKLRWFLLAGINVDACARVPRLKRKYLAAIADLRDL